jgi:hypothetical protein
MVISVPNLAPASDLLGFRYGLAIERVTRAGNFLKISPCA